MVDRVRRRVRCLRELTDPADRRFAHPFANRTHCGPRFTIVRDIPYDRPATTMSEFGMCPACAPEYDDPADRRFHAQPVCCPACGPALKPDAGGAPVPGDPISAAARAWCRGEVLAVKGIGGFQLAVDARAEAAVAELRARKHRSEKPFAVMVPSVREAGQLCAVDEGAQRVLTSWRAPIVLLDRLDDTGLAPSVAPGNRRLGVLIAYPPKHHLLLRGCAGPIVLTSGNSSNFARSPMCCETNTCLPRASAKVLFSSAPQASTGRGNSHGTRTGHLDFLDPKFLPRDHHDVRTAAETQCAH